MSEFISTDIIGIIVGVFGVAHVHLPSNQNTTAKTFVSLKDLRYHVIRRLVNSISICCNINVV
jgi:hypothetical protein